MSDPIPAPPSGPETSNRPRRSFARFLFRTPGGIALLIVGLLALCIAFAPQIAERFGAGYASNWFAERYRGQLEVKSLDLGWVGPQTIEGVELKDPSGARVALVSATLPGLWSLATSGGKRLGKIKLVGEATLYADATGSTNLERALEPREPAPAEDSKTPAEPGRKSSLSELDVELDLHVTRIYWADEHTRELGAPFVLEDIRLTAVLHPGQPLTASMRGTLTGSGRSDLSLDAKVEHPFEAPSSATPPSADVSAHVAHFPTALLDAVMLQGGRLKSLLGDELSLSLDAKGTVQKGSFDLRLDYPHGIVRGMARLEDGMLRSEGDGFAAEFDMHQEFVESVARPLLTGGGELGHISPVAGRDTGTGNDGYRVGFVLSSFEAPVGAYLEASAKGQSQAGLEALLSGVRARFSASLGDWILVKSNALAGRGPLIVRELQLSGELKAPSEDSSLQFGFTASNASKEYDEAFYDTPAAQADMAFGRASVSLTFPGGATLASFTPSAALAPVHAVVHFEEVPTVLLDSLGDFKGDLTRALGPKLALDFDATTSIDAAAKSDLAWADIGARWRELAQRVTSNITFNMRGAPTGKPIASLGGQVVSVRAANGSVKLAPGKPLDLFAQVEFETPATGHFDLTASLGELFADPASKTPLRFSLASNATGLPGKAFDAMAGGGERIQLLLGNLLAYEATAQGTLEEGVARVNLSSEKTQVLLVGRLKDGIFVNMDEPVLSISLQPDAQLLEELTAGKLPEGSRLAFKDGRGVVGINVNFLALPVAELIAASKLSTEELLRVGLSHTRLDAIIGLREFQYEDKALVAAGQQIDQLAMQLNIQLVPGDKDKPTPLTLDFSAASPSWGANAIELHVAVPNAPDLLLIQQGSEFAPIVVRLQAPQFETAWLDAYAGGALRPALGAKLDLTLDSQLSQLAKQPFNADAKLELSASGGKSTLSFKAQATDPFPFPRPDGSFPDLDATLDVSGAGALLAFAPAGTRDLLREVCGEKIAAHVKLVEVKSTSGKAGELKPGGSKADLAIDAGGLVVSGAVTYVDQLLSTVASEPLVLKLSLTQSTLDRLLAGKLPQGASLKLNQPGDALVVELTQLRVPLGRFLDADPSLARADLIENLDGKLNATVPAFSYTHPPAASGVAPAVALLRNVQLHAKMQPRGPASLDVTGNIEGTPPGGLEIHVAIEEPAGFAAVPPADFPAKGSRATLTAKLSHFPSALLDVLANQDGLIVDVLGPELDANVRGQYPDDGVEPLHADLHSNFGDMTLNSRIAEKVIVSEGEQGLDAKVMLTPLFSKRIVGALVPVLVEVRQDDPLKRTVLTGRNLALPMDADLSKLSGDLILDLGAVDYQLLPGLTQALSLTGKDFSQKNTVIKPIAIKITNGIARYDSIPIKISGREINFRGSANLATKNFELAFAVPLEMLGSKVESQLEQVRRYLDPKLEVPLEISGSWSSPRIRLGKGFLEKVLKDAAQGALQGELEKGLGDLLGGGKKKKKDG